MARAVRAAERVSGADASAADMKARMLRGELYRAVGEEIAADQARAQELLERFNASRHSEHELRAQLLRELLGEIGEGVVIRPQFQCDYGSHITIGGGTFVNFGCVMLDVAPIRIGAHCQIATGVHLVTATHPVDPEPRRAGWESAGADRDRLQRLARQRCCRLPRRDDRGEHGRRSRRGRHAGLAGRSRRARRAGTRAPGDRRVGSGRPPPRIADRIASS